MNVVSLNQEAVRRFALACPPPARRLLPADTKIILLERLELILDYGEDYLAFANALAIVDTLAIASATAISAVRTFVLKATGYSDIRVDPVALAKVYGLKSSEGEIRPQPH